MSDERHEQLRRLFDLVIAAPVDQRQSVLARECGDDLELRQRVEAMIQAADDARFLSAPTEDAPAPSPGSEFTITDAPGEAPGTRIGPYKILQRIGEGGFGSVFLAQQETPVVRRVALKIIKLGMDTRTVIARFEAERQALAMMEHPNIARVLDAGVTETGRPYFVMDLVKGDPIAEYCDKNNLRIEDRLELFAQVCNAVQHAHTKGIIHRDIKPSNVLVATVDGRPSAKVIDFGIAKATASKLTEKTLFTEHKQLIGTPEYMSPEQAEGSLDIDTRTDVYSLGVLLYELLTGSTPFSSGELRSAAYGEIQRIIREVDPPKPSTRLSHNSNTIASVAAKRDTEPRKLNAIVRGELDWIVMKALEKDRQRRYETANGLSMDIRRYLTGEAVVAAPPSTVYRIRKFVRRNKGVVGSASAVAAALLIGLMAFAWQAKIARTQRDRAIVAEVQTKQRANELQMVADYQAKMLQQIDPTDAGVKLMADLRARHVAALEKSKVPEAEKFARTAAFERDLHAVNATDAAVALLDRTVLAPAVQTIETQFVHQPLVDASLRTTLGVVYDTLGRPEQGLALYQRAYALRKAALGDDHRDTLMSLGGVANMLGELQKLPESESTARATLAGFRRLYGEDRKETLDANALLASQLYLQGKYDECETITRDILERRRRVQGRDHLDTLTTMNDLGRYLMSRGKYADAVTLLREAADAQRRLADPAVAATLANLGVALNRQKDNAAAEPILREVLDITRRNRGEDHPSTMTAINNLAALLMDVDKLTEAEPLARESLEKSRRIRGNQHAETLKAMNVMGQVLFRQDKFVETEPYYREALAIGRRVLGEDHPDTIIWTANMGFLMRRLGRLPEAETYYREALDKNRRQLGETHPYTISMTKLLADLLRQQNKPAEAEVYLRLALERTRQAEGEDHPETLALIGLLGSVLRDQGKLNEAEPYFQQSIEKARRLHGDEHADTLTAILRMASLRVAQGKNAEAVALLTPIDGKVIKAIPGMTGVLRQASLLGLLGKARTGLAKQSTDFSAAEANLLDAHSTFAKLRGDKDKETREWTQALVDLYDAWDRAEPGKGYETKAAEWRAKVEAMSTTAPAASTRAS